MTRARCLPAVAAIALLASFFPLTSASVAVAGPPAYDLYPAPAPLGQSAGEPSLGVNWNTGNVLFIAALETLRRVSFDDSVTPAAASWEDVSFPLTSLLTLDPILFTDPQTGRSHSLSQLRSSGGAPFHKKKPDSMGL